MGSKKDWEKTKTIYWKDELNDDFNEVGLKRPPVPENYRYLSRLHVLPWMLYYLFCKPVFGTYCFFHGIRVKGKENLKALKKTGYFIYANHVAISDAFKYAVVVPNKRVNVIAYSDTLTLKAAVPFTRALGYIPIPNDINNLKKMTDAIKYLIERKQSILIFPEAHIWPYYTKIRNFKQVSFSYPAEMMKPIIPAVTVWRGKPGKKPKQTIVFGKPIYPNPELSPQENKRYLHEQCLLAMTSIAESYQQVEYIKYIKVEY